jgi:hypothetical protein
MMSFLAALHTIAARRGDGLRPELIYLLDHAKADSEVDRASTATRQQRVAPGRAPLPDQPK